MTNYLSTLKFGLKPEGSDDSELNVFYYVLIDRLINID